MFWTLYILDLVSWNLNLQSTSIIINPHLSGGCYSQAKSIEARWAAGPWACCAREAPCRMLFLHIFARLLSRRCPKKWSTCWRSDALWRVHDGTWLPMIGSSRCDPVSVMRPIIDGIEKSNSAYHSSAGRIHLHQFAFQVQSLRSQWWGAYDDGVIDPRDTRKAPGW